MHSLVEMCVNSVNVGDGLWWCAWCSLLFTRSRPYCVMRWTSSVLPLFLIDEGHGAESLKTSLCSGRVNVAVDSCSSGKIFTERGIGLLSLGQLIQAAHIQSQNGMPLISNGETVKINPLLASSLKMCLRIKQLVFPAAFSVSTLKRLTTHSANESLLVF